MNSGEKVRDVTEADIDRIYDLWKKVELRNFYKFLKHLKGEYEILYSFKDGTRLVE